MTQRDTKQAKMDPDDFHTTPTDQTLGRRCVFIFCLLILEEGHNGRRCVEEFTMYIYIFFLQSSKKPEIYL